MSEPSPVREQLQKMTALHPSCPTHALTEWLIDGIEEALADLRQIDYRTRYLDNAQRVLERLRDAMTEPSPRALPPGDSESES